MAIIIEISSDSEPEDSPRKAARTALQGFQPRKQKVGLDRRYGSIQETPDPQLAGSVDRGRWEQERGNTTGRQHDGRRYSGPAPGQREARSGNGTFDLSLPAEATVDPDEGHRPNGKDGMHPSQQAVPPRSQIGAPAEQLERLRKYDDFHTKEALRRKAGPSAKAMPRRVLDGHEARTERPRKQGLEQRMSMDEEGLRNARELARQGREDSFRFSHVPRLYDASTPTNGHANRDTWKGLDLANGGAQEQSATTHNGNIAIRGVSKGTVLAGAGLTVLDSPPDSQGAHKLVSSRVKHPASPQLPDPTFRPFKRQRMDGSLFAGIQGKQAINDAHNYAEQSAEQLEKELASSLPSTGLQRPSQLLAVPKPAVSAAMLTPKATRQQNGTPLSGHRARFTPADDALMVNLKEVERLSWSEILPYFPGRSKGALQVRYSTKIAGRPLGIANPPINPTASQSPKIGIAVDRYTSEQERASAPQPTKTVILKLPQQHLAMNGDRPEIHATDRPYQAPARRKKRGAGVSVLDGFVPWSQVNQKVFDDPEPNATEDHSVTPPATDSGPLAQQDRANLSSMSRLLRHRELGGSGGRGWPARGRGVPEELKNHVFDEYQLSKHFTSTCGDVTCMAWAPDCRRFAAGSIAISDDRSMQYNSNLNLLIGDCETATLRELAEHHIPRPAVDAESGNVNGLHAMRESQDPRLFMTVAAVAFSPNGKRLYSAGGDKKVRMYRVGEDINKVKCRYEIDHPAAVDLLSVSNEGLLATACHSGADGSVSVFECDRKAYKLRLELSPSRTDSQSALLLFPSALKWGTAYQQRNFLLAGFSSDSIDMERETAGETALWNVETGQRMPLSTVTRNVFDICWNPSPSAASTAFAVASTPGTGKSYRGKQSIVQLYAPGQGGARQVLEWECPAFDINDVFYCPHDGNLLAAGATDGKVYVWDKRFADRRQKPMHTLAHGDSVNVLDHDRDREIADTGVRFLSWGATGSRLYSGSSDGVIKVWNPYRSPDNAHVKDVATFQTAIMSGAFGHDHRDLLIGEECGRINLLSVGSNDAEDESCRTSRKFKLHSAPQPARVEETAFAAAHELAKSKRIEFRPMGALPIRQAVQGPRYDGPYLKPTTEEWTDTQDAYARALDAQNDAHLRRNMSASQDPETETAVKDADSRVKTAQAALEHLQTRHDTSLELGPVAAGNQRALYKAERVSMQIEASLPTEHCKLDCNYLPRHEDDRAGVPDSRRSEQRIPAAVRALPKHSIDVAELSCGELCDLGLAGRCVYCSSSTPNPAMKMHLKMLCKQRCASIRSSFTAECETCSAPVRESSGGGSTKLCERCAFACFRCSQPVIFLPEGSSDDVAIYCEACDLAWRVGVLGYELVTNAGGKGQPKKDGTRGRFKSRGGEDSELLHYHSRWGS